MCFPTFWEFQSYTLGVFKTHFPYTLGVLPFFFCLYATDIISIIQSEIENFDFDTESRETGEVIYVGDGIATIYDTFRSSVSGKRSFCFFALASFCLIRAQGGIMDRSIQFFRAVHGRKESKI